MQDDSRRMSNNRYAPPVAVVREVADEEVRPRPMQVVWAVRLLWATTICSIPQFYMEAVRAPSTGAMVVGLVVEGLFTAFGCYLYVCIHRGKNWARIVTLIFTVLSTVMVLFAPDVPGPSAYERIFTVINTASDIACMYLLFAPPGSAWFRRRDQGR